MTSLTSWLWGTSQIDDAVDKATSELIPAGTEEVALNLEICDQIRSKSAPAKDAMRALKRRLNHKNPNVQILALGLTDICVKNGGDHFLVEVASREFIDNLVSILKVPALNHAVKSDILKHIQNWALAFEGRPSLSYLGQVYKTLKNEGYEFPPKDLALANSAMVDTSTAPEWIDSDVCLRCRTPFTFTNRKHHCRNCGQVFDHQCSSKAIPLPHFGIPQPVRVCDGCHAKLSRKSERIDKAHRHTASMYSPRNSNARDLFDAELQRAIQLSLEEVGASSASTKRPGYVPYQPQPYSQPPEPPTVDRTTYPDRDRQMSAPRGIAVVDEEDDPDLRAAIEASLREANMPRPSAPTGIVSTKDVALPSSYPPTVTTPSMPKVPSYDLEPLESDVILTFSQTIEQVQSQGGRDMSRYPAVSELFDKANGLRPKLAISLDDTGRKEQLLSEMHEKLSQAVKLYDKLLTDQISHPAWRRASPEHGRASTLPAGPAYAPNEYQQWAPPRGDPASSEVPQSPAVQTSFQPSYAPPPPPLSSTSGPSFSYSPYSYNPSITEQEPHRQMTSPPVLPVSSPPLPPHLSGAQAARGYPPVSILQANPSVPLGDDLGGQALGLGAQSALPPHESHPLPVTQPAPTPSAPALPSPVLPASTSPGRSLARAHTVSSRPSIASPPPPPQPHASLARSTTVSYAPPTHARPQPFSRAQPMHALPQPSHPPPHPSLPAFPTVPTSAPQAFDMYAPSVPSAPPQERREEMLIEL
ncbi:ubiquitin binding protein [Imleria badia]|nr:ubiquitin binding protein [Imleria badia]